MQKYRVNEEVPWQEVLDIIYWFQEINLDQAHRTMRWGIPWRRTEACGTCAPAARAASPSAASWGGGRQSWTAGRRSCWRACSRKNTGAARRRPMYPQNSIFSSKR